MSLDAEAIAGFPIPESTGIPGVRDRAQLIVIAYESGLVTPGPRPS